MAGPDQTIIIKKIKKAGHAHHGGAWKIAYADFVTAMMAFFLLLWLISMTTPEQKKGLADYFAPPSVSESNSGAGGVLGGTSMDQTGAKAAGSALDDRKDVSSAPDAQFSAQAKTAGGKDGLEESNYEAANASTVDLKSKQDLQFQSAAASIRQAWQANPDITEIADNLKVETTADGLDIELLNQDGNRMFPEGSKFPVEATRAALAAIAPVLQRLPNQITISGHTAAGTQYPNPRYGSWELSSDRANVVRELLGEYGLSDDRVASVSGRSTADPYFPNDPYLASNERVKITVLYMPPPAPPGLKP